MDRTRRLFATGAAAVAEVPSSILRSSSDVEGSEVEVLLGANRTLGLSPSRRTVRPLVYAEEHARHPFRSRAVQLLLSLSFRVLMHSFCTDEGASEKMPAINSRGNATSKSRCAYREKNMLAIPAGSEAEVTAAAALLARLARKPPPGAWREIDRESGQLSPALKNLSAEASYADSRYGSSVEQTRTLENSTAAAYRVLYMLKDACQRLMEAHDANRDAGDAVLAAHDRIEANRNAEVQALEAQLLDARAALATQRERLASLECHARTCDEAILAAEAALARYTEAYNDPDVTDVDLETLLWQFRAAKCRLWELQAANADEVA